MENKRITNNVLVLLVISIIGLSTVGYAYALIVYYNVTTDQTGRPLSGNTNNVRFDGQTTGTASAMVGATIDRIDIKMEREGTPTGQAYFGIWSVDSIPTTANILRLISTIESDDVTTTPQWYNYTLTPPYVLQANQTIGIFYGTDCGVLCYYIIRASTSSVVASTNEIVCGNPASGSGCLENKANNDLDMFIANSGTVAGIDCSAEENANILICRLTATTGGNIGGVGGIIDSGIFSLFVNAGLIDGTDTNPQTNGIGYIITLLGFGVLIAIFWLASGGRIKEIPTFVWMVSSIALVGVITAIGWIDPTFFIVSVITIAALAAMQMRNMIDRGIDFSSGGSF